MGPDINNCPCQFPCIPPTLCPKGQSDFYQGKSTCIIHGWREEVEDHLCRVGLGEQFVLFEIQFFVSKINCT